MKLLSLSNPEAATDRAECAHMAGRLKDICNGTAYLPISKINAYRTMWGLDELPDDGRVVVLPRLGGITIPQPTEKPCRSCGGRQQAKQDKIARLKAGLPGSELVAYYKRQGMPSCQACQDLAAKMDEWGVAGCRERIEEIVADILPRAQSWVKVNAPWVHAILPSSWEDAALRLKIRHDVNAAIDAAEAQAAIAAKPCCGQSVTRSRKNDTRIAPTPPLTGVPIDRAQLVSHIIYHVMPLAGNAEWIWRRHVKWLREVRPQFNGRLIVGIVTKSQNNPWEYVSPKEVMAAFDGMDAEFIVVPNDNGSAPRRGRGEGATFPLMLEKIKTDNPNEVFFYGHSKAITHADQPLDSPVHKWTEALFDASFRNRDAIIDALDYHGIAGSFRVLKSAARNTSHGWHYSGTFWGCRSADVFQRDWKKLAHFYGCVEMWVNGVFSESEGACLFLDAIPKSSMLYNSDYWNKTVTPAWTKWKEQCAADTRHVTIATVVFNPSPACIANVNRIMSDAKRQLGNATQTVVIDNSPLPTSGIVADVYHWNRGANNQWGGAINQAVQAATGDRFIHFSATRTRVHDQRWMRVLLKPLSDPACGMTGPVQRVPYSVINETNPRPGEPEMHVQQAVFAARTETLRKFPWGSQFPHCFSDVWQSWSMVKGGLKLVNVPEVTSAAGMEKCKPGAMLECVATKL